LFDYYNFKAASRKQVVKREMFKNYQISQIIYESYNSLIYRGFRKEDRLGVILKILKENYPSPSELTRYKQEYNIIRSLNSDGIIKAYQLDRYENSLVICLEDFGGKSLNLLAYEHQFTLKEFLSIAIKIAEALAIVHAANIIHKDINPSNIVYNLATKQLKIIDFGISSCLAREQHQRVWDLDRLEGTLAYIAPEQTGRVNRAIDYRSDLYSLGVSFYELLSGKLPFEIDDPIELVHCHIAKIPRSPHEILPSIPVTLSEIVMKLLAKTPEQRYQSPWGLKADLETCLDSLASSGQIASFTLASQDIWDRFEISQQLYGRQTEITQLLTAFERVGEGKTEMILISGYSGIGKSSLVAEFQKQILYFRGYFIRGKFEQFKRDIPYSAVIIAFQNAIAQLLTESEDRLKYWREEFLTALKGNAGVIVEIIPSLERIIGKQPPIEQLEATEAQNRFNLFFKKFVAVFTKKEHPLVIFFDDLQWVDLASLKLIELLISDLESQYLLIIGAYRDNEVDRPHPLLQTIDRLQSNNVKLTTFLLQPLALEDIQQLIADSFNSSPEESVTLAELVKNKTQGNPFFLTQLLQSLYIDNLIFFNYKSRNWNWSIAELQKVKITDNVIDLSIDNISKLQQETRKVLQLAACIGNQFNLELLGAFEQLSPITTAKKLLPALEKGLILPLSNDYKTPLLWEQKEILERADRISDSFIPKIPEHIAYQFLHDKVQEAAYALIDETEKKVIHLQLARFLLQKTATSKLTENIFDIVNHFNLAVELITSQAERYELAKLNLIAGTKAKKSTAYKPALRYLKAGLNLLGVNSWSEAYSLTLELYTETIEIEYLNTNLNEAKSLFDTFIKRAKKSIEKVKAYEIKIKFYISQNQMGIAIDTAQEILQDLGLSLSKKNEDISILNLQIKKKLTALGTNIEDLANFPEMSDRYQIANMRILMNLSAPAFIVDPPLWSLVIITMVKLSIEYGNCSVSSFAYGYYGNLLCGSLQEFDRGYQFGKLSLKLLERFNATELKAKIYIPFNLTIRHWKEHIKTTIPAFLEGIYTGIYNGDIEFACYNADNYCANSFFAGTSLETVQKEQKKYLYLCKNLKQYFQFNYLNIWSELTLKLVNDRDNIFDLIELSSEPEKNILNWIKTNNTTLIFPAYLSQTIFLYLFKEYDLAVEKARFAEPYQVGGLGFFTVTLHNLYSSLSLLAYYNNCDSTQKEEILKKVENNQKNMKLWTEHCPANFENKYNLIAAERARVLGDFFQAQEYYERAILLAKKAKFVQEEAIAYERAAEFYLSLNREEISKLYLKNAYHCYYRWGANAKVKALTIEYPELIKAPDTTKKISQINQNHFSINTDSERLDLQTIIKAHQTLTSEIVLEKLLAKLMTTLIENAGAQKGLLLLQQDNEWTIEAQGQVNSKSLERLRSIPIDSENPLLPFRVINYVIRTKQNLVLDNAINNELYKADPYIIEHHCQSILCIPLVDRGREIGILYLENNLATGVFGPERVELLKILSSQAAISIENARLYQRLEDYSHNLEQTVKERTQELLQTVEVLKATQAELIFENTLLRKRETSSTFSYQVGGSLPMDSPTYAIRNADRYLYRQLQEGEFCYILTSRQMGKSSLMVRMMQHLQDEGFSCAAIDMSRIGSENITSLQWYKSTIVELWRSFGLLKKVNFKTWWGDREGISLVQLFTQFIEDVLLVEVSSKIVIFIDEIDSILGLNFSVDDFLCLIRSCYNQRCLDRNYYRLSFVILGVATPNSLIQDRSKTPFNIGKLIELSDFKEHEAQPLLQGLQNKINNPQTVLKEVLLWTGGQPFLTQKICQLIANSDLPILVVEEVRWLENLVKSNIIDNWEYLDEPEHLRTIRDRILASPRCLELLKLYRLILEQKKLKKYDCPVVEELLLSGIAIERDGYLRVRNRIYQLIFDSNWIEACSSNIAK